MGLEPTHSRSENERAIQLRNEDRVSSGIEPETLAPKARMMQIHYETLNNLRYIIYL